jgi:Carboxypeptidase regulatory-like domain
MAHPPHVTPTAFCAGGAITKWEKCMIKQILPRLFMISIPIIALLFSSLACVQDCIGASFSVRGRIIDKSGNPVGNASINAWNNGSFERPAFNVTATSDSNGYFGCTTFEIKTTAVGYKSFTTTYYPPAKEGWSPELPTEITITLEQ